jgi:hypothetical protein
VLLLGLHWVRNTTALWRVANLFEVVACVGNPWVLLLELAFLVAVVSRPDGSARHSARYGAWCKG